MSHARNIKQSRGDFFRFARYRFPSRRLIGVSETLAVHPWSDFKSALNEWCSCVHMSHFDFRLPPDRQNSPQLNDTIPPPFPTDARVERKRIIWLVNFSSWKQRTAMWEHASLHDTTDRAQNGVELLQKAFYAACKLTLPHIRAPTSNTFPTNTQHIPRMACSFF